MEIIIGSTNPCKVQSVEKCIPLFYKDTPYKIVPVKVNSNVSDQPLNIGEIITGAKNRALACYQSNYNFSIGIESGLNQVGDVWFESTCVSVYNGDKHFLGFSPAWECPKEIINLILEKKVDMAEAVNILLGKKTDIGQREGLVGVFTHYNLTREEYTKCGVIMALSSLQWQNNDYFYKNRATMA